MIRLYKIYRFVRAVAEEDHRVRKDYFTYTKGFDQEFSKVSTPNEPVYKAEIYKRLLGKWLLLNQLTEEQIDYLAREADKDGYVIPQPGFEDKETLVTTSAGEKLIERWWFFPAGYLREVLKDWRALFILIGAVLFSPEIPRIINLIIKGIIKL